MHQLYANHVKKSSGYGRIFDIGKMLGELSFVLPFPDCRGDRHMCVHITPTY